MSISIQYKHIFHRILVFLFGLFLLQAPAWAEAPTHSRKVKSPQVTESVSTVARCEEGYVISGNVITSASDVKIVETSRVDCDADGQCKAYQVTALRKNGKDFDIDVTVTCTEDGLVEASEGAVQ